MYYCKQKTIFNGMSAYTYVKYIFRNSVLRKVYLVFVGKIAFVILIIIVCRKIYE